MASTYTQVSVVSRARRAVLSLAAAATFAPGAARAQAGADLQIPAPRGLLSDFAGVVPADRARIIEIVSQYVRDQSGGEIAVVTLRDIGGRDVGDVALRIGREWKVGLDAAVGDARRNAGIVVLLVPRETSADGRGYISIQVVQGAEGFVPDGVAGAIRREATEFFRQGDYGGGLALITVRLAERYAAEFGFSLDSVGVGGLPPGRARTPRGVSTQLAVIVFIVLIVLLTRGGGRGGCLPYVAGHAIGHAMGRRGRWHGHGGFGGGFGGGGGGFGGFGGGGGFSGGGSSGSF